MALDFMAGGMRQFGNGFCLYTFFRLLVEESLFAHITDPLFIDNRHIIRFYLFRFPRYLTKGFPYLVVKSINYHDLGITRILFLRLLWYSGIFRRDF